MAKTVMFIGDQISKQPQAYYEKMLQVYADKWDTDIVICICHGRYEAVPSELSFDKLYIYAQLLPKDFENLKKSTVKSYKINGKELVFPVKADSAQQCPQGDTISFTGAPKEAEILEDDNHVPIAAIYDGGIYILNDFIHSRGKSELDTGIFLLQYVLEYADKKTKILSHLKSGVEEKSKRALEYALKSQFSVRLDKEILQLKAAKETIEAYTKSIVEAQRKVISTEKIVDAIRMNIKNVPTALEKTWKSLDRMNNSIGYSNISFTKSGLKAITTPIVIKYKSIDYDIGRFNVSLGFDGTCKIINLDHKIEVYDHPHINDGNVCWGNFSGWIPKLVGSSEFDVALDQIYTFLCHYDNGSPYKHIESWQPVKGPAIKMKEEANQMEIAQ